MTVLLCIAGICAVLAGLLAIAFGIPVQEFSFGNTLILAGAIAICSGLVVLAQAAVVRELKAIARRLGSPSSAADVRQVMAPSVAPPAELGEESELPSGAVLRSRRNLTRPEPLAADAKPSRRHHLMFSSSLRKDQEVGWAPGARAAPQDREGALGIDGAVGIDGEEAENARQRPDRLRGAEPQQERTGSEQQPGRGDDRAPASVIKSGVVQGMVYSLYSDGSIEAKLPEGLMRFATIEELRAHLDSHL